MISIGSACVLIQIEIKPNVGKVDMPLLLLPTRPMSGGRSGMVQGLICGSSTDTIALLLGNVKSPEKNIKKVIHYLKILIERDGGVLI